MLEGGTGPAFEFRTSAAVFKKDHIKYELGIGLAGKARPVRRTITLHGRWNIKRGLGLSFEVEYGGGSYHHYRDHDERGNPGRVILAAGSPEQRTIYYTYHPEMNLPLSRTGESVLGSGNKVTIWDYDNDGNADPNENPTRLLHRVIERGFTRDVAGGTRPYETITRLSYNANGQVLSIDGPLPGAGDSTSFAYDAVTGDLLGLAQPLIGETAFSAYDAAGMVGRMTDVNGQSRRFIYDAVGRMRSLVHEADGSTTTFTYNGADKSCIHIGPN